MGINEAIAREASDVTDEIQNAITAPPAQNAETWEESQILYAAQN